MPTKAQKRRGTSPLPVTTILNKVQRVPAGRQINVRFERAGNATGVRSAAKTDLTEESKHCPSALSVINLRHSHQLARQASLCLPQEVREARRFQLQETRPWSETLLSRNFLPPPPMSFFQNLASSWGQSPAPKPVNGESSTGAMQTGTKRKIDPYDDLGGEEGTNFMAQV